MFLLLVKDQQKNFLFLEEYPSKQDIENRLSSFEIQYPHLEVYKIEESHYYIPEESRYATYIQTNGEIIPV